MQILVVCVDCGKKMHCNVVGYYLPCQKCWLEECLFNNQGNYDTEYQKCSNCVEVDNG